MLTIWDIKNQELLPIEDNTKSMRKSTTESIITPLTKTVKIIDNHTTFVSKLIENNLIISMGGNLCKVLDNQNMKLGNL